MDNYRQRENTHWDGLIELTLDKYRRLVKRTSSASKKIKIYETLENVLNRIAHEETHKSINKRPYSINDYFEQLGNKKLNDKINSILDHPNKNQARKILTKQEGTVLAKKIGIDYSTFIQVKNGMFRGHTKNTANYAKVARYMLTHGYKL